MTSARKRIREPLYAAKLMTSESSEWTMHLCSSAEGAANRRLARTRYLQKRDLCSSNHNHTFQSACANFQRLPFAAQELTTEEGP